MKIIPEKLATLRKNGKLTQVELASKINIGRATYKNWELGKGSPSYLDLYHIAQALGITIADMEKEGVFHPEEISKLPKPECNITGPLKKVCNTYSTLKNTPKQSLADHILDETSDRLDKLKDL